VTEFATSARVYCRNPKCRSRLKAAVHNEREVFCARGCHTAFYRKRCLICEEPMECRAEHQRVCGKLDGAAICGPLKAIITPTDVGSPLRKSIKPGLKTRLAGGRARAWAIRVNGCRIRASRRVLEAVFRSVAIVPALASHP
jgi:hypothetical protein